MSDSTQAQPQITATPEQVLTLIKKLDNFTRQILFTLMQASIDGDVVLMRACVQQLPEEQRHIFDEALERADLTVKQEQIEIKLSRVSALISVAVCEDFASYNHDIQSSYMQTCESLLDEITGGFQEVRRLSRKARELDA